MTPTQQHATLAATNCPVAFDNLTRQLYATDASHYQIEPLAVAFPRDAKQAAAIIQAAAHAGVPVIPRGAGTGLVGGAIGEGVVVDFSRFNRLITDFDAEKRTVRVGAGVVLDQLNDFLCPEGFAFGPDVATSSRATLGGMIANNSSGARTSLYGTTADHLVELEIVLGDGRVLKIGPGHHSAMPRQRELLEDMVMLNALQIAERFPPGLLKRWPGYALDRIARDPANLINVLAGSEGTLAAITSAVVKLVPTPDEIVEQMCKLGRVTKDDIVYDMGCGDGRILIMAAKKYGARGVGIDLDPVRIAEAKKNAQDEGVSHLVDFRAEDGTKTDISKATVVTLYMFKWFNNAISPKLQKLRPGSRVVAHDFDIDDWKPTSVVHLDSERNGHEGIERPHTLYLWLVGASAKS